jgi:hypothetical protein
LRMRDHHVEHSCLHTDIAHIVVLAVDDSLHRTATATG